jgi:hypothetical protein
MKNKKLTRSFHMKNPKTPAQKPLIRISIAVTFTITATLTLFPFNKKPIIILPLIGFHFGNNVVEPPTQTFSETIHPNQATNERILDKVAEINRLTQMLHGLPVLPLEMRRPTSIEMNGPADIPVEERQRENEKSLDQELKRLQTLLNARNSSNG